MPCFQISEHTPGNRLPDKKLRTKCVTTFSVVRTSFSGIPKRAAKLRWGRSLTLALRWGWVWPTPSCDLYHKTKHPKRNIKMVIFVVLHLVCLLCHDWRSHLCNVGASCLSMPDTYRGVARARFTHERIILRSIILSKARSWKHVWNIGRVLQAETRAVTERII